MDPLSVTASAIALLQAAAALGKGIQAIRSFRRAPAELCALLNELTTLQALSSQFEGSIHTLSSTPRSGNTADALSALANIHQELAITIDQLDSVVQRFVKDSKGFNKDGQRRIPRLRWHLERENITQLRNTAKRSREYLTAFMASIQLSKRYVLALFSTVVPSSFVTHTAPALRTPT